MEELPDDAGIVLLTRLDIRWDTQEILRLLREDEDEDEEEEEEEP
jgi:hypothetical protein